MARRLVKTPDGRVLGRIGFRLDAGRDVEPYIETHSGEQVSVSLERLHINRHDFIFVPTRKERDAFWRLAEEIPRAD